MYTQYIFYHLTRVTYKHAVYMRCHHKNNCNHRFSNLFQTHPFDKLCTPYTSLRGTMYIQYIFFIISPALHTSMQFIWDVIIKIIAIIVFQTYSKHIPPRSYVSQYILPRNHVHLVHPYEELCIPNTSFYEAMYSRGVLPSFHLRYMQVCSLYEISS